jgi:iron(III) transport system ATP-binding protein
MTALLSIRDACVGYGSNPVVREVSLEVQPGEIVALLGPSGCGKTTLLRAIAGFEPLQRGSIDLAGERVSDELRCVPTERRRIGMVFQQGALFPHMTVKRNVAFGLSGDATARRTDEMLASVGLSELAARFPDQLSGGQQQLVALARAMAPRPNVILLDEPFAGLDIGLRESIRDQVAEALRSAGATAVLVTHDQQEAFGLADRVAVMQAGMLLQTDTPPRIYERPASLDVARLLGGGRLLPGTIGEGQLKCALGSWRVSATSGPGFLLVRHEDFELIEPSETRGYAARLVRTHYRGQDLLHDIALDDDSRVQVRTKSLVPSRAPGPVRLDLRRGEYRWFPDGSPVGVQLKLRD